MQNPKNPNLKNLNPIQHNKHKRATAMLFGLFLMPIVPVAQAMSLEERVERLERMNSNPVILKTTQQVSAQQRELQELQNRVDLLEYQQNQAISKSAQQPQTASDLSQDILPQIELLQSQILRLEQTQQTQAQQLQQIQFALELLLEKNKLSLSSQTQRSNSGDTQTSSTIEPMMRSETASGSNLPAGEKSAGNLNGGELNASELNQAPSPAQSSAQSVAAITGPIKTRLATESEDQAYQQAFGLMRKSQYEQAVKEFVSFAQASPESSLAPNAWYWAGEGYYILGDNEQAKRAFEQVITLYPGDSKESDAKLRLADALMNLQQTQRATALYQQLIVDFPTTRAAENAKKRLDSQSKP